MNKEASTCDCSKCDCPWNYIHWTNTKDYQYEYCAVCNEIKSFHWKSFWKRTIPERVDLASFCAEKFQDSRHV